MHPSIRSRAIFSLSLIATLLAAPSAFATTWIVDKQSAACSDAGPGTPAAPFCTIGKGAMVAAPGDTVQIRKGFYREQVVPPASGAPGLPITYKGTWPFTHIVGTDSLSSPALWTPAGSTAFSAPFDPVSDPTQVFVDGKRLATAASAATTTPNSFFFDAAANVLYVDIGGGNPAAGHVVEAGAREHGFELPGGTSHIVIRELMIWGQNHSGIRAFDGSNVEVRDSRVSLAFYYGISMEGASDCSMRNNVALNMGDTGFRLLDSFGCSIERNLAKGTVFGIELLHGGGNLVSRNISRENTRVGINCEGSSDNRIIANNFSENKDSGGLVRLGSEDNLVARNIAQGNMDNGFQITEATGTRLISNTVYRNQQEAFEIEGGSTGTVLANNIAVDNGLTAGEPEVSVDAPSVAGFEADYDLLWKSAAGSIARIGGVTYATLADFMAGTGQETNGVSANPNFVNPGFDLHIALGPAVDAADADVAGFVQADREGKLPLDIPGVADTGNGTPTFADRGAFEYIDRAPHVALLVFPFVGKAPHKVTAIGLAFDDHWVTSYTFDFGDGTIVGPQPSFWAKHTYVNPGLYTVTVKVTDAAGFEAMSRRHVLVLRPGGFSW